MTLDLEDEGHKKEIKIEQLNFAKQLFFGRIDTSRLFPYPRVPLEERERIDLLCHKLRQFSETYIDPISIDRDAKIPEEILYGLGKLGLLGLNIPQQYGGLGMSLTAFCRALEVTSQRCGSTTAFLIAHQSIGYRGILLFGTQEQKQRWLPSIAKGETIAAFALTEENAGSDPNSIETKAIYDSAKNVFYLTGKKRWITNGSFAKIFTVLAKTEVETSLGKKQKITAFLVTSDMPGFKLIESAEDKIGMRGIQSSSLEFDHMAVPAENILGQLGEGVKVVLSVLNYGLITIGASCTGPAKLLVDHSFKYARERLQFQRPLSSFALIKHKLAMLAAQAYAIDAVTYFTAGRVDAGKTDFMLEAAIVKVFSTESLLKMIFDTMEIFGGKSMFKAWPFELMLRDSLPNLFVEGSNDVLRLFLSSTGINEVNVNFNNFIEALKNPFSIEAREGGKSIFKLFWPASIEVNSPTLKKEAKSLTREVQKLGRAVVRLLLRYKDRFSEKQLDISRIGNAVICVYAVATVISKLDSDLERAHEKQELLGCDIETAKFFCRYALKKAQNNLNALFDQQDKQAEKLSDLLIEDL